MSEAVFKIVDLEVMAHLPTLMKYHFASSIFKKKKKKIRKGNRKSKFKVRCLFKMEDEHRVHPCFDIMQIIIENLKTVRHVGNLLALVQNLIDIEGGKYQSGLVYNTDNDSELHLHSEMASVLTELEALLIMQSHNGDDLTRVLKLRKGNKDIIAANFLGNNEMRKILDDLIYNRIKILENYNYPLYVHAKSGIINWTLDEVVALKNNLDNGLLNSDGGAFKSFRHLVIKTVHSYLTGEMKADDPSEFNETHGAIIFSLLSVFRLISLEDVEKYTNKRSQTEYLRVLRRMSTKSYFPTVEQITNMPIKNIYK